MFEWACTALFCVTEVVSQQEEACAVCGALNALKQIQSLVKGLGTPCERAVCELCGSGVRGTNDGKHVKRKSGDVEGQGKWRAKWKVSPQKLWKRGEQTASQQKEELSDTADICKAESCTSCKETHGWCLHQLNNPDTLPPLPLCRVGGFLKGPSLIYSKVTH